MHIACTTASGFDVAVTSTDLAELNARWPGGIGHQLNPMDWRGAALLLSFDRRGDLVDVIGDEGLDELPVTALVEDARDYARIVHELN